MDEFAIYSAISQCYNPGIFIICHKMAYNLSPQTGLTFGDPDVANNCIEGSHEVGIPAYITNNGRNTMIQEPVQPIFTEQPVITLEEVDLHQPDLATGRGMYGSRQVVTVYEEGLLALNNEAEQ